MCSLGVPVGCRMKHAKGMFKRWRLRAGKRQACTPIDLNFYYGNAGTAALALKDKTFRQNLTEENVLAQSM